jgi:transcriptional regulator with XRE-family HTH domain
MTVGERLKSLRQYYGLTPEELAARAGLAPVTIGFFEADRSPRAARAARDKSK